MVLGPDGVPYVLDRASKTVYRVDLRAKKATAVVRAGASASGTKVAEPRHLAVGGPDVLVLDSKNVLWRWRPADAKGKGTLARIRIAESSTWGADILGVGTFVRNPEVGLYNLYVIDPSEQQILRYSPAQDGSGYPGTGSGYLTTPQDVSRVTSMYIDGEVYVADAGIVERFISGRSSDWGPDDPPDKLLRPVPVYRLIGSPGDRGEGTMYGYDPGSDRFIAFDKGNGKYLAQYRIAGGRRGLGGRARLLRRQPGRRPGPGPLLDQPGPDRVDPAAGHRVPADAGTVGQPGRLAEGVGQAHGQAEGDAEALICRYRAAGPGVG